MLKQILIASLCLAASAAHASNGLTELETRWLRAAAPVLAYSQQLKLPIDIVVQPQARPGDVPLAMGFTGGRCKLVLSMRGNPDAETILDKVPAADRGLLIEAMTAHEVGHCWRYAQGAWHALPAGFVEVGEEKAANEELLAESKAMRETRREEAYADLVALAWTQRTHPAAYGRVYGWLASVRRVQPVARNAHDTRAWVKLAGDPAVFDLGATPFEAVLGVWRRGLLSDE